MLCTLLLAALLTACSSTPDTEAANGVYYWRTSLSIDSTELAFLKEHHIDRFYCRYFDVVMGNDGEPVPNATITFSSTRPRGVELIPTIYITEDCMHQPHPGLAERIVQRICQMNETHDLGPVSELQIDCDFTARSRQTYYDFLQELSTSDVFKEHFKRLSVTIRLHQLSMAVPPADYGVLMLYNTGDPARFQERNPILDLRDVQPYLRYLAGYRLPLAAAYPVYTWHRQVYGMPLEHSADSTEIMRVKRAVEQRRNDLRQQILLYHLSDENIHHYSTNCYEKILKH